MRLLALGVLGLACHARAPASYPSGDGNDDGNGELMRASVRWTHAEDGDEEPEETPRDDGGGNTYGGGVPPWQYGTTARAKYAPASGPSGGIEGVITWRGAVPAKRKTACGAIEPLPLGEGRGIGGVVVFIERVRTARPMPNDGRPASVGGVIVKRGCALLPPLQIVTPLPAALVIHGDATLSRLRVTGPNHEPKPQELEAGGLATMQLSPGITQIESEAGELAAAWVLAIDTPYYAVTDDAGRFRIDELPPGPYQVQIWQPPLPTKDVPLTYGAPVFVERSVVVSATRTSKLDVALGR